MWDARFRDILRSMDIGTMNCCGLAEVDGLCDHDTPKEFLQEFCANIAYERSRAFYILTDLTRHSHGEKLGRYIHRNKLGRVSKSISRKNANTNNFLTVYIWAPDHLALSKWRRANPLAEDENDW